MIELICLDVDGTLTNGSLVYGYLGNLSLGMQFRTCENFGDFADSKSSLNPQNFHKYKSHTANTSIVLNAKCADSSLRGARSEASATKQSKNSPSLAEGDKGGGLKAQKNSSAKFANNNSTHPLAPSAREGGHNVKSSAISQKAEFAEIAKVFNVKDGLAIAYWRKVLKRKVAIITGKSSEILRVRANELQIPSDLLFMNVRDKGKIVRELKQRFALKSARIAAVGDDLNDISMFAESSLNFAPNDCATALKSLKNLTILNAKGGEGAVRESIEAILQKEKLYEKFIQYWQ